MVLFIVTVFSLLLISGSIYSVNATCSDQFIIIGDNSLVVFDEDASQQMWYCYLTIPGPVVVEWLHNGSIITNNSLPAKHTVLTWTPNHLNDSGIYTCRGYSNGQYCGNISRTVTVIDSSRVQIPEHQFTYLHSPYTLHCTSDAYNISKSWTKDGVSHTGTFNSTELNDEGLHNCAVTILGATKTYSTTLHVLVRPEILSHPQPKVLAYGPNSTDFTIIFNNYSPGGHFITWYKDNELINEGWSSSLSETNGSSTLHISRRGDKGKYRVVIASSFGNISHLTPSNILQQSTVQYTFDVDVIVLPALPQIQSIDTTPYKSIITWSHTNANTDDAPDIVSVTLLDKSGQQLTVVHVNGSSINCTFNNLIPATSYSVYISVSNEDGFINNSEITGFNTMTTNPSIQSLSSTRIDTNEFNITINFNYLGANDISSISIGYRPITKPPKSYHYIKVTSWSIKNSPLEITTLLQLNDTSIVSTETEFMVKVTNSADESSTSDSVKELLEPLGPPSQPSFVSITTNSTTVIVQLPFTGTPPIFTVSFTLTSTYHTLTIPVNGLYKLGEIIQVTIGGANVQLQSGIQYNVSVTAENLHGWSNTSSITSFITLTGDPLPSSLPSEDQLPLWIISVSGIIPGVTCVMIIIATVLFICLYKKFKVTKKGYPITPASSVNKNKLNYSPEESRHIRKYFSYDSPLTPRPPTAEPIDLTVYQSNQEDSDSETTQSSNPRYKYVISPTPKEVGIRGYLGSTPGSGSYIYV